MEKVVKIQPAIAKNKKYQAIVKSGSQNRKVNFGHSKYPQYKDTTGLKKFSKMDHNDEERRQNYFQRHSGVPTKTEALKKEKQKAQGKITPKILAHTYLW